MAVFSDSFGGCDGIVEPDRGAWPLSKAVANLPEGWRSAASSSGALMGGSLGATRIVKRRARNPRGGLATAARDCCDVTKGGRILVASAQQISEEICVVGTGSPHLGIRHADGVHSGCSASRCHPPKDSPEPPHQNWHAQMLRALLTSRVGGGVVTGRSVSAKDSERQADDT